MSRILPALRKDTSMWEQHEPRLPRALGSSLLSSGKGRAGGWALPTHCSHRGKELLLQPVRGAAFIQAFSFLIFLIPHFSRFPHPTPAGPKRPPDSPNRAQTLPRLDLQRSPKSPEIHGKGRFGRRCPSPGCHSGTFLSHQRCKPRSSPIPREMDEPPEQRLPLCTSRRAV